ncbi:MAG: broad specificity phosphatase PhoE [Motiliproteus sp.]|jgi:broad specificity phosphatase PhoE
MKSLLLVRHAERPHIPQHVIGNDVLLTERGEKQTLLFANQIQGHVISIRSSPIPRCLQTAKLIAMKTGFSAASVQTSQLLGDPGFIIEDGERAWKHWQEKGHHGVNQHLLDGTSRWEGFAPLDQATKEMTQVISNSLNEADDGVHVWITHDTILATYASRVLQERLNLDQWPDFLGYLRVDLREHKLYFRYVKSFAP